jgi:hypothetical protein
MLRLFWCSARPRAGNMCIRSLKSVVQIFGERRQLLPLRARECAKGEPTKDVVVGVRQDFACRVGGGQLSQFEPIRLSPNRLNSISRQPPTHKRKKPGRHDRRRAKNSNPMFNFKRQFFRFLKNFHVPPTTEGWF